MDTDLTLQNNNNGSEQDARPLRIGVYFLYIVFVTLAVFVVALLRNGILPYGQIEDAAYTKLTGEFLGYGRASYEYDITKIFIQSVVLSFFYFLEFVLPLVAGLFMVYQNFHKPSEKIWKMVFFGINIVNAVITLLLWLIFMVFGAYNGASTAIVNFIIVILFSLGFCFLGKLFSRNGILTSAVRRVLLISISMPIIFVIIFFVIILQNNKTCGATFPGVINSNYLDSNATAACNAARAVKENNPNLCIEPYNKYGSNPKLCYALIAKSTESAECVRIANKYGVAISNASCNAAQAIQQNNPDLCEWSGEIQASRLCYKLVARDTKSPLVCDRFYKNDGNKEEYKDCYLALMEETKDFSSCKLTGVFDGKYDQNPEWCFAELARRLKDASACDGISDFDHRNYCLKDTALLLKDPAVCGKIPQGRMKNYCINQFGN